MKTDSNTIPNFSTNSGLHFPILGSLIAVFSIFVLGLVLIFNTSSAEILDLASEKNTHQALKRQMIYALCGAFLGFSVWKLSYRKLFNWSPQLLCFFSFLLLLCLIPGIGRTVNGSRRWIQILGLTFQPSEFVKFIIPAYLIHSILSFKGALFSFYDFLKLISRVSIPMGLILIEPNNGTVGVIGLTLLSVLVLTQVSFRYWALPLILLMVIGGVTASQLPYVQGRIKVYWNPEMDLKGKGHQPYQAKIAAGTGKLLGKGPGSSLQKLSYLPEAQNDYIAAIYAEEFGFLGISFLILLYMFIAYVGFSIAFQAPDKAGCYLAASITFLISFQAFMNLGVVSGLLPSTGLNLPFFSQGGTSIMANAMGLGFLLSVGYAKNEVQN
jgi:cell division protein FtsW